MAPARVADETVMDVDSAGDEEAERSLALEENKDDEDGASSEASDSTEAEYDIYITEPMQEEVLLFQYPNRDRNQPYNTDEEHPIEFRVKPVTGFVEMDVSQNVTGSTIDRLKAGKWGETLQKARETHTDQYGLATGFGRAVKIGDAGSSAKTEGLKQGKGKSTDTGLGSESAHESRSMKALTLGGQIVRPEAGQPVYMQGVFRGNQIHLTPLAGYVQMRPQFHHLDAEARAEANQLKVNNSSGTAKDDRVTLAMQTARAAGETDEELSMQKTAELLSRVADEQWSKLAYFHEDSDEAFQAYDEKCFLRNPNTAPRLVSDKTAMEYLESVAGLSKSK